MSAIAGLIVVVVVIAVVVGLGGLAAQYFFSSGTDSGSENGSPGTFKVDKAQLIASLDKKVRAIPADRAEDNYRGYKQLLELDPGNERYRRKVAYYRAKLKAQNAAAGKAAPAVEIREYVKIAYPDPQVLDRPELGQMIGRAPSGEILEVLEKTVAHRGSTEVIWYRVPYKGGGGWISQLGVFGDVIRKEISVGDSGAAGAETGGYAPEWKSTVRALISDYDGKVLEVERLNAEDCWVQVSSDLSFEEARQVSEHLGYYLRNSTGFSPAVRVFVGDMQIAVARAASQKYRGKLDVKIR
jgi:hypothetical protein